MGGADKQRKNRSPACIAFASNGSLLTPARAVRIDDQSISLNGLLATLS
jgi:hypothetical protein